jgi:hypothetical protein
MMSKAAPLRRTAPRRAMIRKRSGVVLKIKWVFPLSKCARIAPKLCWGDEWPTLSPGRERVRVRGK